MGRFTCPDDNCEVETARDERGEPITDRWYCPCCENVWITEIIELHYAEQKKKHGWQKPQPKTMTLFGKDKRE